MENQELMTTMTNTNVTTPATNGKRISTGAFAGICAGCAAVGTAIGGVIGWFSHKKWGKKKEENKKEEKAKDDKKKPATEEK